MLRIAAIATIQITTHTGNAITVATRGVSRNRRGMRRPCLASRTIHRT
jgi:hypothetical protein